MRIDDAVMPSLRSATASTPSMRKIEHYRCANPILSMRKPGPSDGIDGR
jgi:hypothetical protein